MYKFLLADSTFRALNIPISQDALKEMNRKIKRGEAIDPVITWNGFILSGYEQDDLCLKFHRGVVTKEMLFPRKSDAVAWLCHQQLKREDLHWAAKAWLISRLYEALRDIARRRAAKDNFQYKQLSPSACTSGYTGQNRENVEILRQLGEEFKLHKETIRRYVRFGRQLDRLEEIIPGVRSRILTGDLSVMMIHMPALIKMPPEQLRRMINDKRTRRLLPSPEYFTRSPERKTARQRVPVKVKPGIKQMPEYDPDADLNGLSYTVTAWRKAISRTAIQADLNHATETGKDNLKQGLRKLIIEAEFLYEMLEEKHNDRI